MKHYSVSRALIFEILIDFDFRISHFGELFVDAFINDADAKAISARWPKSISLL
jgi:hypothetical protein